MLPERAIGQSSHADGSAALSHGSRGHPSSQPRRWLSRLRWRRRLVGQRRIRGQWTQWQFAALAFARVRKQSDRQSAHQFAHATELPFRHHGAGRRQTSVGHSIGRCGCRRSCGRPPLVGRLVAQQRIRHDAGQFDNVGKCAPVRQNMIVSILCRAQLTHGCSHSVPARSDCTICRTSRPPTSCVCSLITFRAMNRPAMPLLVVLRSVIIRRSILRRRRDRRRRTTTCITTSNSSSRTNNPLHLPPIHRSTALPVRPLPLPPPPSVTARPPPRRRLVADAVRHSIGRVRAASPVPVGRPLSTRPKSRT